MKTFNYFYSNSNKFINYVKKDNIDFSSEILIQIFNGKVDKEKLQGIIDFLANSFPNASIISTTTAGEIIEGGMSENSIVVSISIFEKTNVKVKYFEKDRPENIAKSISNSMVSSNTKLLIIFSSPFHIDGELLITEIQKYNPDVMIAGGNAGDCYKFKETLTGVGTSLSTSGVAVASLDSDYLQINNGHLLNWNRIGKTMLITKSKDNILYEIDHKSAQDVYRHYLGDMVADNLSNLGVEFPLMFSDDNIDIARAPLALLDDGAIMMAGHIEQGTKVQFSFGNYENNNQKNILTIDELSKNPIESIYIYSSSSRKSFFKNHLNDEFNMFQQIAPIAGFITFGEFYKNKRNHLLNVSSSYVTLSETDKKVNKVSIDTEIFVLNNTVNAMQHLIEKTAEELEHNSHNLEQFQSLIKNSTIYSVTDLAGIITDVNDRFCKLSGYSKKELIGKSHNIVRHPTVDKKLYMNMWKTIQNKKVWKGVLKNKTKDNKSYFVRTTIMPILGLDDELLYYVSTRDNITQEVLKVKSLEGTASFYENLSKEKEWMLEQYENVINANSAFIRVDSNFKITHVNEVFCNIFNTSSEKLLGMAHNDLLEPQFLEEYNSEILELVSKNTKWNGMVKMQDFHKNIIFLDARYSAIYDKDNKIVEYMGTYHDVTQIIEIQQEIEKTQSDVVLTMGSIGETRSKETGNHVKRVAEYSKEFALLYGLSKDEASLLKMASPMHDIGKVGIPDAILNKPGKLTKDEFTIMKTHSSLGFNMLRHSTRPILNAAAIIALTHHERWDGEGYPKGLKSSKIPIFGRITAIADVFDALGSDRCYKKAWSDEDIFKLLKDSRAKQFDPKLVDIFFDNIEVFLKIRDEFKD